MLNLVSKLWNTDQLITKFNVSKGIFHKYVQCIHCIIMFAMFVNDKEVETLKENSEIDGNV